MKLISEKSIIEIIIEYDNTNGKERTEIIQSMDDRFGIYAYKIKRMGPKSFLDGKDIGVGLMIVHGLNQG